MISRQALYQYVSSLRAYSFPVSIGPFLLGIVSSYRETGIIFPALALLALASVLFLHAGANILNDYYDFISGVDFTGAPGPSPLLTEWNISPDYMLVSGRIHIAIGCFLGIPLVLYHGWLLAAIGAAGFLIALSYTASRFSLKYNAFGEAAVFTAFGPLAGSAAAVSATGTAPVPTILISCGPGLLAASVLLINNIRDRKTDRKAGAVTIPVLIGRGKSVVLLFLLMLLPYSIVAGGVLYSLFHQYIMVVLLTLPLAGKIWLDVKGARTPGSYTAALKQTVVLHTAYVVFCTVSLVFT